MIWLALSVASCAQMPQKPTGSFCNHDFSDSISICNDLATGKALPDVPIAQTDKWIMFPPETWQNIQNYIDELIRIAENKLNSSDELSDDAREILQVYIDGMNNLKSEMISLREKNKVRSGGT